MPEAAVPDERVHLGANVYCWDLEQQNRALADCLAPLLEELRRSGTPCRLFFDRHDVRGPHLLLLLTVPASERAAAGRLFAQRLEAFLERLEPPRTTAEEALVCHRSMAEGRAFAEPDRAEGLAEPGSCVLFEQPENAWPFAFAAALTPRCREAVWQSADQLARGVIERLASSGGKIAAAQPALLVATFDEALGPPKDRASFWRFYCASFLPKLEEELRGDPEPLRRLEAGIGRNGESFDRVWNAGAKAAVWPEAGAYARALLDAYRETGRWRLPRELLHTTLKQLMLHPRAELPLAFYAWRRSWKGLS